MTQNIKTENNMSSSCLTRRSRNKDFMCLLDARSGSGMTSARGEQGRSMVEMLGVLAVIGVLSVVGGWMYLYLMGMYKENETLNIIDKVAVGAYTSKDKGEEGAGIGNKLPANVISSGIEQRDEYTLDTRLGTAVSAFRLSENEYEVYLENISYGVCKKVLNGTSDYVSAYLNRTSGDGIYVGDSEEDKDAFCEKVDAFKREVPYIDVQENNPNANMILCYSLSDEGCVIPYTASLPTERPCGVIPHGDQVNDCGVCDNGNYRMGAVPENPCVRCDATTNYINEARIGEECQDSCHVCDASKNCVAEDEDRPEDCGGVCCPDGKCNSDRTGCQQECAGGCNVCQMCDTDTGSCVSDVRQNGEPQDDGKCCVDGVLKYDENLCPARCEGAGTICQECDGNTGNWILKDSTKTNVCGTECCGAEGCNSLGTGCKKACEGMGTVCQECDDTTGEWKNVANGTKETNEQDDGKCCVDGALKYDATLCPEPKAACDYDGETYQDGESVNDCGICKDGTVNVDTNKYFPHCECSVDTDYKKTKCSCPDGLYETCPSYLTSVGSFDRGDSVQCHTCRCPTGTTAYKKDKNPWRLNTESEVQDEIGYCCDYQKPLPGEKLGECAYCDTDIKCNPGNLGSDCPENSFCFNSGDNHGWHCHAKSLIRSVWGYAYGVKTGAGLKLMTAWDSGESKIAANVCAALGKSPVCVTDGYYSWSANGSCMRASKGQCKTYSDSKCNNQNVTFSGTEKRKGGVIYCH